MSASEKNLSYYAQLKHPQWQRKRLLMLEAAGWACTQCESKENTLHVHHKRYVKGRMAWEYEDIELDVLCDQCHLSEHAMKELLDEIISTSTSWMSLQRAVGLVGGYLNANYSIGDEIADRARSADPVAFACGGIADAVKMFSGQDVAAFIRAWYPVDGRLGPDPALELLLRQLESLPGSLESLRPSDGGEA